MLDDLYKITPSNYNEENQQVVLAVYARSEQLGSLSLKKSDLAYYSLQFFNVGGLSHEMDNEELSPSSDENFGCSTR